MSENQISIPIRKNIKVLVVNSLEEDYDPEAIQDIIEKSDKIKGWWNHFPGVWLVETEMSPYHLSKLIYSEFDGITCFVTTATTGDFSGRMNGAAWLWLIDVPEDRKEKLREKMIEEKKKSAQALRKSKRATS